jgi:transcriptional/translational regulatory protein YebC/TACO1
MAQYPSAQRQTRPEKAASFTKVARMITVTGKQGGEIRLNFTLRLAIGAKEVNLPKKILSERLKGYW